MRVSFILFSFILSFAFADEPLIEKDFKKKIYKNPLREFSIIVTDDGFYPNKLIAYVGEKVRFFVTSTTKNSQCFVLQKHEVFISAEQGHLNETETTLENPGRYKFYCPTTKHSGYLTVIDKASQAKEAARSVASESEEKPERPKYWTPRDYDE